MASALAATTPTPLSLALMTGDGSSLTGRAAAGDGDALAELFRLHAGLVHRVAFRLLRSADDADDVLQDVFIGLPEALQGYRDMGRLEAWLTRVTMRACLVRLRHARRHLSLDERVMDGRTHSPAHAVDARLSLERALASLPPAARDIVVRRELEGRTHAEIAAELGINRNASEVRFFRALKQLRTFLGSSR